MTDTTNLGLNRPAFGDTAWDVAVNENADIIDALFHATTGNHDHNGTTGHGKKLAQSATHESPDTDVGPTSLHHTLGTGANQAAAGNHTHTGYAQTANNLADLASAATARTNLGLGTAATHATGDYAAATHHTTHSTGGTDAIAPADIGAAAAVHTHTSADVTDFAEAARDTLGAALVAGANVTITVNDAADTITIASTGSGGSTSLTVDEVDGLPSVVTTHLTFPNGSLTNNGGGQATVAFPATATPTAHASTHASGGSDPVSPASIGAAATTHTHAASDVTSGTLATVRLGSGTADATTYLRGDQTWAPVSTGSNPLTTARYTEEFGGSSLSSGQVGNLGWTITGGLTTAPAPVTNHPGIINRSTGTTSGTAALLYLSNAGSISLMLPSETFDCTWIVRLNQVDTNTTVRVGISTGQNPPNDGVFFEKLDADTNWCRVARNTAAQTRTDTGVAVTTGWVKLRLRRIDASTIGYTIDGGSEQTLTTNVPTNVLVPLVQIVNSAAAAKTIDVDYMDLQITVTR